MTIERQSPSSLTPLPLPRVDLTIRPGVMSDVPFMDSLQKLHSKQVGWMPTKQLEEKIRAGQVLVAEEMLNAECGMLNEGWKEPTPNSDSSFRIQHSAFSILPLGYCIATDQYFKRDDLGIIYQMNVAPGKQRALVGASLLKAQFERSAYGCKLYCCWCAQDIAANKFWEAMGFVPLAYRAGGGVGMLNASDSKSEITNPGSEISNPKSARPNPKSTKSRSPRVHIFWQKRIRAGDVSTPWWFPSKTAGGAIREDRIVLPIPPGTHWSDAKPLLLQSGECSVLSAESKDAKQLAGRAGKREKKPAGKKVETPAPLRRNGLMCDIPQQGEPLPEETPAKPTKQTKPARVKVKCNPRLVAAARELRDRWLEQVNAGIGAQPTLGKYDVSRAVPNTAIRIGTEPIKVLPLAERQESVDTQAA